MKYLLKILCLVPLFISSMNIYSQDDEQEIHLTKKQFRFIYDQYAVSAIKLLARLDTLNSAIDSLKVLDSINQSMIDNCENEMYSLVGTTRDGVNNFRRKFEETENKINNKIGTPSDTRMSYFNEISSGRIICLPEFSSRFNSMKRKLEDWEGIKVKELVENKVEPIIEKIYPNAGTYTVKEGDNLWLISEIEYGTTDYWNLIWEANKNGVVNKDYFYDPKNKFLTDPNYIYPGQILKIPDVKNTLK